MPVMLSLRLGSVEYLQAWRLQKNLAQLRAAGLLPDVFLMLEHPPVVTLGRGWRPAHLLASRESFAAEGIAVHEVDRGGDVTYHGPGQLVGYPIVDLRTRGRDVHAYLRDLEEVLIGALRDVGLNAGRFPPHTGVWIDRRKIAAIGIRVSRWITTHGFALNVDPNLHHFDLIVPCGIRDHPVTSIRQELGRPVELEDMAGRVVRHMQNVFGVGCVQNIGEVLEGARTRADAANVNLLDQTLDTVARHRYTTRPCAAGRG